MFFLLDTWQQYGVQCLARRYTPLLAPIIVKQMKEDRSGFFVFGNEITDKGDHGGNVTAARVIPRPNGVGAGAGGRSPSLSVTRAVRFGAVWSILELQMRI